MFDINNYIAVARTPAGYNPEAKKLFLTMSKRLANITAESLRLQDGSYDIRVNKAGVAVSGEVTLHGENIYVQFGQSMVGGNSGFLCRTCKGRKDYTGGRNHWYKWEDLGDFGNFIYFLNNLS